MRCEAERGLFQAFPHQLVGYGVGRDVLIVHDPHAQLRVETFLESDGGDQFIAQVGDANHVAHVSAAQDRQNIPEALVPFVICRSEAGLADFKSRDVAARSNAIAMAFGLPHVLTVSKPVQPAKGQSSYAAAAEKGIPAILAEAGGVGQMQEEAVALLCRGVINVMRHLGMIEGVADVTAIANDEARMTNDELNPKSKVQRTARRAVATTKASAANTSASTVLTQFEWVYTKSTGVWYPKVAAGDAVREGEQIGTVRDLFGDTLEEIVSPVKGVVLFLTINPSVIENGLLMGIGVE